MKPDLIQNVFRVLAVVAILLVLTPFFCFVIDERELGVVLRFGEPIREQVEPGVYMKIPFVETVRRLPKTRQFWGGTDRYLLPDLPTNDDKKIELIPWAMWQIDDQDGGPTTFVQRLRTNENAEQRVAQFCRSAIRDVITQYDLAELVRSTNRTLPRSNDQDVFPSSAAAVQESEAEQLLENLKDEQKSGEQDIEHGRGKILEEIKERAQRRLALKEGGETLGRGIRLIDVGISQIAFVDSVRIKTFDRWVAERDAISAGNVNEGERLKAAIINETNAEVQRIEGEGQEQASKIKGEADADVITEYAKAINATGEFYTFVRTLEAYEKSIGSDSRMILTTDSEFFRLLKKLEPAEPTKAGPVALPTTAQ